MSSESLFERALKVSPGGVHSPVRSFRGVGVKPRFIERADKQHLFDVDGNRYTDYCLSWGPLIFGHRDPDVEVAVKAALERGWTYGAAEPYSLALAEEMVADHPVLEKVRFVSSGTEAVMSALRVARAATGRRLILKFDGMYHGHADAMLVRAGSGLAEMASPDSAGVTAAVAQETLVVPMNDLVAYRKALELHGRDVAAVIVEPIPANNGLLPCEEGYLDELVKGAHGVGALVIFDEVITGFRAALGGVASLVREKPDLVTYGKVMGGGFPVGAYGGRAELMNWVAPAGPVYQAGTLSANPVAVAAGHAQIRKLKKLNPFGELRAKTRALASHMEEACSGNPAGLKVLVQNEASLFWPVFFSSDESARVVRQPSQFPRQQKAIFSFVFEELLKKGIYLPPSGFEVGFLSTAHSDEDLNTLALEFGKAVYRWRGGS